jgi:hypothetical protein
MVGETAVKLLALLVCSGVALAQGTLAFSPQQVTAKHSRKVVLTLWNVDYASMNPSPISAVGVYMAAVSHGIGHMNINVANEILTTAAKHSPLVIGAEILGASSALTLIVAVIRNNGLINNASTMAKVQNGSAVGVAICAIGLPYLQKYEPVVPDPVIAAAMLGSQLSPGVSALFYSLPSQVGPFTVVIP